MSFGACTSFPNFLPFRTPLPIYRAAFELDETPTSPGDLPDPHESGINLNSIMLSLIPEMAVERETIQWEIA